MFDESDGTEKTLTQYSFAEAVENLVISNSGDPTYGYIEATSEMIESLDCEVEEVKHLISLTLIEKIKVEAIRRGMLNEKDNSKNLSIFMI